MDPQRFSYYRSSSGGIYKGASRRENFHQYFWNWGGFNRFSKGEVDINNASRVMKQVEKNEMKKNSIQFTPFEVANDGLTIVVNRHNTWVDDMSVDELRLLWSEDGREKRWSQIHSTWPREQVKFYAPGVDSGTYDYFQNVILQNHRIIKKSLCLKMIELLCKG